MKTKMITFLAILIFNISYGQVDCRVANWKVGNEKIINGNTILRVEGKNKLHAVTNICYKSYDQLLLEVESKSEKEMWTSEQKNEKINLYNNFALGGLLQLYITRLTIDAANTEWFTIIIKDSNEKEILRKELEPSIPNTPSMFVDWSNYGFVFLNSKINGSFFVYVIDKLGNENSKFKFEIKQSS
jgi:hypothetical protein